MPLDIAFQYCLWLVLVSLSVSRYRIMSRLVFIAMCDILFCHQIFRKENGKAVVLNTNNATSRPLEKCITIPAINTRRDPEQFLLIKRNINLFLVNSFLMELNWTGRFSWLEYQYSYAVRGLSTRICDSIWDLVDRRHLTSLLLSPPWKVIIHHFTGGKKKKLPNIEILATTGSVIASNHENKDLWLRDSSTMSQPSGLTRKKPL